MGDKLPMFVIEKYKMPGYFIGLKHLPFCYRNQKKSVNEFSRIRVVCLRDQQTDFASQGRKIVVVVDKYLAHTPIDDLKSKNLVFLTPIWC